MGNTQAENGHRAYTGWERHETMPGSQVRLVVPARLEMLAVLGAAVREYCAALPELFSKPRARPAHDKPLPRQPFGTRPLQLPGSAVTVTTSYSHFVYSAELILMEAAGNIIRHGYSSLTGQVMIGLELSAVYVLDPERQRNYKAFVMELSDSAPPFDPATAAWREPDPLEPRESGYGIYLIHRLTNGVSYRYENGHNYLRLVKFLESLEQLK